MKTYLFVILGFVFHSTLAQVSSRPYIKRDSLVESSILKNYPVRNIGPVVQGGRIVDIEVNTGNPKVFYVGFASGGVWKTIDHGVSFRPVFDNVDVMGVGDMAIAPSDNNIIYVGTGENNSSRSSYAGTGVYKSADGGATWQNLGLANTQHIGKVLVHPENPDVVWVASVGALYSHNADRGVYKSIDGGKTWRKALYINDSTGVIDLVINPENPDQLWASAWERTRKAWDFKGNGPGSAIYRSDDGGNTWQKKMEGFPQGEQVGRIGLAVAPSAPNVVYAFLDNQAEVREEKEEVGSGDLQITHFRDMTTQHLLDMDDKMLNDFLKENNFPEKYTAQLVKKEIREGKYEPIALANYFGDANEDLFTTSIVGAELYRSDDSGNTWKKMNSYDLDGVYYTYGYYFGEVRVAADDEDLIYVFGVPLLKSKDGGLTYSRIDTVGNVHVDHQALWVDPDDPEHLLLGNDGGLYESYNEGADWRHINNMPVGQFYTVNYDMEKPYNIYGGLQDNGTLKGSSRSVPNRSEQWEDLMGGDGMFVAPDPRGNTVYVGFQFGNYYRRAQGFKKITPQHDIGEPVLRFNWRAPMKLSRHNPDIVYIGAQKMYRSFDKGDSWQAISPDLTKDLPQGNVPFSTISTFSESPLKFGVIYAGTDDGNVQLTKGAGWENTTAGLPENKWVSSIVASFHDEATVFVTLNGYRGDDFKTYAYMSTDYGETWQSLKANLPEVVVNDLIEDPVNPGLLYLGTDHGTYVSFNKGASWEILPGIPNVPAYDLEVHPRENELIVATHGRSIYIADVKPFQQMAGNMGKAIVLFGVDDIRYSDRWGQQSYPYVEVFEPKMTISMYAAQQGTAHIQIVNGDEEIVREWAVDVPKGFSKANWDLKITEAGKKRKRKEEPEYTYVKAGEYKIIVEKDENSDDTSFEVK